MDMNKILDYVQNFHFVSLDAAYDVLADFGENSESVMIGKSDYILIYDADKKMVVDGESYLPADYVVMRSYYGLQPIERDEVNTVISALMSRMATLVCGKCRMQAYQLD